MLGLCFLFKDWLSRVFTSIPFNPFFVIMLFSLYFGLFADVPLIYLMLRQKAKKFILLTLGQLLTKVVFTLYFISVQHEGAVGFMKGNLFSNLLFTPIYIYIILRISTLKFNKNMF